MSSSSLATPIRPAAAALGALLVIVTAGALTGALMAARLVGAAPQAPAITVQAGPFEVGHDVPTSFGFVAVEHAEALKGLTARQLAGAVHGIGTFVGRDKALVQASVTITNTTGETLRYDPEQFRLVARRKGAAARTYGASHANIRPGVLQPDAAIDAQLSYVVARDGSRMSLNFDDPGRDAPVVIDLRRGSGTATAVEKRELRSGHGAASGHDHGN
jgi:hypothetical protein